MRKIIKYLFVSLFLATISLPVFFNLFDSGNSQENSENRAKAKMPEFEYRYSGYGNQKLQNLKNFYYSVIEFKDQYNEYFIDNFRWRNYYIKMYLFIKTSIVHSNPFPEKVVNGMDGWLFLGDFETKVLKFCKGIINFSESDIATIDRNLSDNKNWFLQKGIRYYIALVPDKNSFYGEYLPIKQSVKKTKFQQLKLLCANKYNLVDLSEEFEAYKKRGVRLYHKTDTHWNDYGAFLGFKTLIQRLSADHLKLQEPNIQDFSIDTTIDMRMDLTNMLYTTKEEKVIKFKYLSETGKKSNNILRDNERRYLNPMKQFKVLVFGDSYSFYLDKYFKETFGEVVLISPSGLNRDIIEKEQPDIVIHEMVERNIDQLIY